MVEQDQPIPEMSAEMSIASNQRITTSLH